MITEHTIVYDMILISRNCNKTLSFSKYNMTN